MEPHKDFKLTSTPRILLTITALLLVARVGLSVMDFLNPAQPGRGVAWVDSNKYVADANDARKLKLYEFYAGWCSPCLRLERDVMTNSEIREAIEQNFVPIRVVDRQREDGHNTKEITALQKRYRVFAFPTLVAVGEDGEPIALLVGNSSSLGVYRFVSRVMSDHRSMQKRTAQTIAPLRELKHSLIK